MSSPSMSSLKSCPSSQPPLVKFTTKSNCTRLSSVSLAWPSLTASASVLALPDTYHRPAYLGFYLALFTLLPRRGLLGSSLLARNTQATAKIAHLGDMLAALGEYDCSGEERAGWEAAR